MEIKLRVNGEEVVRDVEPRLLLVHLLRDTLGLTGAHVGCDTTNCGACSVHLDGHPVKSCTVLAVQVDGAAVTTIEDRPAGAKPRHDRRLPGPRDPASDLPAVMLICEATLTAQGPGGQRTLLASELFRDYLQTTLGEAEILTEVRIPALDGWGFGYQKFNRRSEDWAMVAVSALVKHTGDICEEARIGLTNMASVRCARTPPSRRCAGSRSAPRRSLARPSRQPRAPTPQRTSTPAPNTSAIWRTCSAGVRWSRPRG